MRSLNPWPIFPQNLEPPTARSLSLLFILEELLISFQLVEHLQKVTPEQLQGANLEEELALISRQLEKFLLFSLDNPFTQKGGALDKLCFYSEILLAAAKAEEEGIPMVLEEMRSAILKLKSKLVLWKKALHPLDQILIRLFDLYSELQIKLETFFSSLLPYLQKSRTDENILIYLIENKENFNRYLGEKTIENLLRLFFPAGSYELRAAICEGFTRRGFSDIFIQKEPLLHAIEW